MSSNYPSFASWPCFSQQEADAVSQVLLSNKVNYWSGNIGRDFEKAFAAFSDCSHAVAVANGTLALDLCLHALGIGASNGGSQSDEVIVTPRTFIASISSIVLAGATPVFADVDVSSQNITPSSVKAVISPQTKAVIAVHLAGWPCDMHGFRTLANEYNIKLIEDCAQAHGAKISGQSVGSFGDIAAWSFCQDKIMTTGGEGGMVTTNDEALWQKVWSFKDHGKSYDTVYHKEHPPGFRWLHESFGSNFRLTEMQSAIGLIQLQKMPQWQALRSEYAAKMMAASCECSAVRTIDIPSDITHAHYKHYLFIQPENLQVGWTRDSIIEAISAQGVPCLQGSCSEVYLEKAFDNSGFKPSKRLPNARRLGDTSIMFLVHPSLSQEAIEYSCGVINKVLTQASR